MSKVVLLFSDKPIRGKRTKLTEKPPFTNPKNRKYLWLILLYAF